MTYRRVPFDREASVAFYPLTFIIAREFGFNKIFYSSSIGGHSGEGSVSASGLEPHPAINAAKIALKLINKYEKKFLLVSIRTPFIKFISRTNYL